MNDYEPYVCEAIEKIIEPGWVCADVGANVGQITTLLANLVKEKGKVIAFEILPDNINELKENIKNYSNVVVENLAISNTNDFIPIYPSSNGGSKEWNILGYDVRGIKTNKFIEVKASTMDEYFKTFTQLNFVKIDVEGAEFKVIEGMSNILQKLRPYIIVEFHEEEGWEGRFNILKYDYSLFGLYTHGYKIFDWVDVNHTRIYHCLLVPNELKENINAKLRSKKDES